MQDEKGHNNYQKMEIKIGGNLQIRVEKTRNGVRKSK
jgi:hypothetical protein